LVFDDWGLWVLDGFGLGDRFEVGVCGSKEAVVGSETIRESVCRGVGLGEILNPTHTLTFVNVTTVESHVSEHVNLLEPSFA
jgi:hypothetical protein